MYIWGLGGLYPTIWPDRGFYVRGRIPRSAWRTRGPKARGHGVQPEGFSTEDVKNRGQGGYIVRYSPTRSHIYKIYTTFGDYIQVAILIKKYLEICIVGTMGSRI